jgi:drug/metabolite transporter (DMT)-like permease
MLVYAKLVGSVFFWGATWISGRILAQDMGPFSAALLRFVTASAFLLFWSWRANGAFPALPRKDVLPVAFLGLTGIFLYNAFFFTGLQTVPAGRAALIIASVPVIISIISALMLGERLTPGKIAGTLLSLTGASIVLSGGNPLSLFQGGLSHGDLMILGCVAAWTAYSVAGSRVMKRVNPLMAVTWSCILGTLMLLTPALTHGLLEDIGRASLVDWGNILFLGVVATGVAFTWYYAGIRAIGAARAGIFINLVPVFAIAMGYVILDEPVTSSLVGGGLMVISGVWLANRKPASTPRRDRP